MHWTFTAENWSGRLDVRAALDGGVNNQDLIQNCETTAKHFRTFETGVTPSHQLYLLVESQQSHLRMAQIPDLSIGNSSISHTHIKRKPDWIETQATVNINCQQEVTVQKTVAIFTTKDRAISNPLHAAMEPV
ncbi:MAG: hypothetical protein NPIRA01_01940 [Nitrospirales bacterium]|nr:MAG: hypothetical protein NPIRA01_01940 [Nitrospirales bacterium]